MGGAVGNGGADGGRRERLARLIISASGATTARILGMTPLRGGAIQENWAVDIELSGLPSYSSLGSRETLVLRRSEEHTSELQSLMRISDAVFCLKKKKEKHKQYYHLIMIEPKIKLTNKNKIYSETNLRKHNKYDLTIRYNQSNDKHENHQCRRSNTIIRTVPSIYQHTT